MSESRKIEIMDEDALVLPSISDGSISAVVTDPPWGEHDQLNMQYEDFAKAMLATFDRVSQPQQGRLVLLLGRRVADTVSSVLDSSPLNLRDRHNILVNGHPASVLVGWR